MSDKKSFVERVKVRIQSNKEKGKAVKGKVCKCGGECNGSCGK